mgnify:CR=1 FL=1
MKFASYAFNKSHATCYSWVAYQTAYLKANYPSEYMAAVLSRNLADIKTITQYITECKQGMGINVLGPDVNESQINFSSNKSGDIRFGMAAIKGVGEAAVRSIIEERENNGPYKNIYDFVERVNFTVINRKCMESIAFAGGFDSIIDFHRSKFFAEDARAAGSQVQFIELLMRYGQRVQQERLNAQQSLFGGGATVDIQPPTVPVAEDWNQLKLLGKEREVIGLYLSAHPLDDYKVIIDHMCKTSLSDLSDLEALNGQEVSLAGVVTAVQEMTTKTGRHFGKFTMEDYNGTHEFALFGKDYEQFRPMMFPDYFLFVRGKVQPRPYGDNPELEFKILSMQQLAEVGDTIKEIHVQLPIEQITAEFVQEFSTHVRKSKGKTLLRLTVVDRSIGTSLNLYSKRYRVELTQRLTDYLDQNEFKYSLS